MNVPVPEPADEPPRSPPDDHDAARLRAERRRRIDEMFGDVLPSTTADERDADTASDGGDRWFRENRPPHHGS